MLARARAHWQRMRTTLRGRLGFSQAAGRDVDLEQAILRVIIAGAILLYAGYVAVTGPVIGLGLRLALVAAACAVTAGLWMVWRFRTSAERPPAMRYFGICADLIPLTIGLWGADEPGVPLIGVYLWVTVGNGFRFGPRYLLAAYWLSAACFTLLLLLVPFWQAHRSIGVGFGVVLATIPLYVLVLLSRLTAQKDAVQELSNAKSRFVANVSHELRTPLTGVFAVYDLLKRKRLAPDEQELIGSLGSAITTLKSSVDAVLQMSKIEAGGEQMEPRLFNLRCFLQQLAILTRPQAEAKRLAWSMDIDADIPASVVGDPTHLRHVLGNLINNALKFTPKGGVTLRAGRTPNGVRFEVTDTGIGIALEAQETLFERFVQADSSATRRYGGTGLGTSIARDLTVLMGGKIGLHSAPGQGTTFWLELPLRTPDDSMLPAAWGAWKDVLVVGPATQARYGVVNAIATLGLVPVVCEPTEHHVPTFDSTRYLAALLVLPITEAATYVDSVLRDRAGAACPWLVATTCSSLQAAVLLRAGAVAVLPSAPRLPDLQVQLAAVADRLDLSLAASDTAGEIVVGRALNILLADDNRSNQMLLARILGNAGHKVRMAERGGEAFDLMAAGDIDLAILDLNMPDMSGPDITKIYRAGETGSGARLPIIILSADATAAAKHESLAAGANDYLTKPVITTTLLATIERVVAGVRPRERSAPVLTIVKPVPTPILRLADTAAPSLVDADRIEALRRIAHNDRTFLDQYVAAAFGDLENAIGELCNAVEKRDLREAHNALHKIDGTSASIGATALTISSKNMRNYLTSAPDSDAAAALAEVSTTCALTKSAVAALLHVAKVPNRNTNQNPG